MAYNHGNQPGLQAAWLFHFAGRPDLTRRYVHSICERFYGTTPAHGYGFGQDEDQGQLGAWFVLAALGLFDVEGMVRPEGTVASIPPLFSRVILSIPVVSGSQPGTEVRSLTLPLSNPAGNDARSFVELSELWRN